MQVSPRYVLAGTTGAVAASSALLSSVTGYGTLLSQAVVFGRWGVVARLVSSRFADQHDGIVWGGRRADQQPSLLRTGIGDLCRDAPEATPARGRAVARVVSLLPGVALLALPGWRWAVGLSTCGYDSESNCARFP